MTSRPDLTATCDGCGRTVGGGGLNVCVVVSAVRRDAGDGPAPVTLHLCLREQPFPSGDVVGGCAERALVSAVPAFTAEFGALDLYDPVEAEAPDGGAA